MPDDTQTGTSTDVIATDHVTTLNGVAITIGPLTPKVQRTKVTFGPDGTSTDVHGGAPLPVAQSAITKGTQGATGVTTQALKDAGRARVSIVFLAVAPAVADTLLTLVKTTNGVAAAGAASIGVAAGKTLRITAVAFSLKSGAAAAAFATFTLRQNPAGATAIGSASELRLDLGNTAATIGAADKVTHAIPDGMEFSGAHTLGASLAAQAITNVVSITLTGFEY